MRNLYFFYVHEQNYKAQKKSREKLKAARQMTGLIIMKKTVNILQKLEKIMSSASIKITEQVIYN